MCQRCEYHHCVEEEPGNGVEDDRWTCDATQHRHRLQARRSTDKQQHLEGFVQPQGPLNIDAIANQVVQTGAIHEIAAAWKLPVTVAIDLCQIALFDVVMLIDDSGSMHAEHGERIKDVSA